MEPADRGQGVATRAIAAAAVAIAGLLFSLSPWCGRADLALLDAQWRVLRAFEIRPAPLDIVIVGIDEATVAGVAEPRGMWHEALGKALARIAAARPRAIGLDVALPERSFESSRPGLDHALVLGLAAARQNGPFVATLSIDARTRGARPIHPPFLAVLREERLGIDLLPRDDDGVTRRYVLSLPTEDGSFPTFTGRLCRAMEARCDDGLLDFALGPAFRQVPMIDVLQAGDMATLEKLFRDRIVLVGETLPYADRVAVPVGYASWEKAARETPAIVVHALALRTALAGSPPQESSRPMAVLLVSLAALLLLVHNLRVMVAGAVAAGAGLFGLSIVALRSGVALGIAAPLFILALVLAIAAIRGLADRYVIRRR